MYMYSIYALRQQNNNKIMYIGMSNNPNRRIIEHRKDITNTAKHLWITTNEVELIILLTNILDRETALIHEELYIKRYKPTFNRTLVLSDADKYKLAMKSARSRIKAASKSS